MKPLIQLFLAISFLLLTGCEPPVHSSVTTPSSHTSYIYYYSKNGLEISTSDNDGDTIFISNTDISEFPVSLLKYVNATELIIEDTKISNLPEGICALSSLRKITLGNNQFKTIPNWIGCLKSLNSLLISGNQFDYLPAEIGNLSNLEDLSINGSCCGSQTQTPEPNGLVRLPNEIGRLSKLKSIFIYGTALESLPKEFYQLTSLQDVLIMHDDLQAISPAIQNLSKLERLDLSDNPHLSTLPAEIGNISSLRELDLFNTGMDEIPDSITRIANVHIYGVGKYNYSAFLSINSLSGLSGEEIARNLLGEWLQKNYLFIYHIDNIFCSNSDCSSFSAKWHSFFIFNDHGTFEVNKWKEYYGLKGPYSGNG
ncbi:MAG: hypothetical protein P4L50_20095 [Anaerolineaceae bacterium]|nr:hypothetical protein [Anaerolineaceae bacterium]